MTRLTKQRPIIGLVGWLVGSFITAGAGAAASVHAGPFYAQLVRPEWAPPASLLGPVWTVLYTLMGVAAWLVSDPWLSTGWRGMGAPSSTSRRGRMDRLYVSHGQSRT